MRLLSHLKYVTRIKGIFSMFEKYGVALYEQKKVYNILYQITYPNKEFNIEVKIYRSSQSYKFFKAYNYLSKLVLRLYLSNNTS